jgi:serine/threonine-protein kinase
MLFKEGDTIGGYIVLSPLGEGGFGEVYMVRPQLIRKPLALKIIKPDIVRENPQIHERFIREMEILSKLQHPRIVQIMDARTHRYEDLELPFFVMEYLPMCLGDLIGEVDEVRRMAASTMDFYIEESPSARLSLEETLRIGEQLCDVLEYIHGEGILHLDLTPRNVLLRDRESMELKLCDFGIARTVGEERFTLISRRSIYGTPYYIAPELLYGRKADARADIYSLGAILYRVLTGFPPGTASPDQLVEGVPKYVSEAIVRATMPDVDRRVGSVSELRRMLFPPSKREVERVVVVERIAPEEERRELPVEIVGKDGAPMVLIPAGEFQMGDHFDEGGEDERPVHTVYLDAFYIDKYEVTNELYARFLNEIGSVKDEEGHLLIDIDSEYCLIEFAGGRYRPKPGYEKHPVVEVSWWGAVAYAKWAGKRLPTEAEWEKAARGGLVGKRYPWGDEISHDMANYWDPGGRDRWEMTSPVGSFPPNGYGLYDMAGNVWEWCADWYDENYYSRSPRRNPKGPESGEFRVVRGGSWGNGPNNLRVAIRISYVPSYTTDHVGFRCVQDVTP